MTLKTLKDCNDLEEARVEAVKWVKNHVIRERIWIEFFNLTKEDFLFGEGENIRSKGDFEEAGGK